MLQFIVVVCACAGVLNIVYRRISGSEPDGPEFASTIFILTIAIGLLVSIIKQAPAISFGLFGAMSIVRFRAQIKRPRRMIFVFMAAAIGVCCGAGEYVTTIAGTIVLSLLSVSSFGLARSNARPAVAATAPPTIPGNRWGVDLIAASLTDGRRIRVLAIVDETTHEALATIPDTSFSGARVVGELDRLIAERGRPATLISDTWPEFGTRAVLDWSKAMAIDWQCIELSSQPEPEPLIVVFTKLIRDECLSARSFANVIEARVVLEIWRAAYNARLKSAHAWRPVMGAGREPAGRLAEDQPGPMAPSPPQPAAALVAVASMQPVPPSSACAAPDERASVPTRAEAIAHVRPALVPALLSAGK